MQNYGQKFSTLPSVQRLFRHYIVGEGKTQISVIPTGQTTQCRMTQSHASHFALTNLYVDCCPYRECGWRDTDPAPPGTDPCAVCLERKCTVAAEGLLFLNDFYRERSDFSNSSVCSELALSDEFDAPRVTMFRV